MDDVTALRDALLDDLPVLSPNLRHPLTLGKAREVVAERFDALIAAVEARAALTPERLAKALHRLDYCAASNGSCRGGRFHIGEARAILAALATDEAVS